MSEFLEFGLGVMFFAIAAYIICLLTGMAVLPTVPVVVEHHHHNYPSKGGDSDAGR